MRHEILVLRSRDFINSFVFGKTLSLGPVVLVYTGVEEGVPLVCYQLRREGLETSYSFWVDTIHFPDTRSFRARVSDERKRLFQCLDELLLPSGEPGSPVQAFLTGTPFATPAHRGFRHLVLT